jgi:hypothetical protein
VTKLRDVLWSAERGEGFEHLRLTESDSEIRADGWIVRKDEGGPYRATYRIRCDAAWNVTAVEVTTETTQLSLVADGRGGWRDAAGERVRSLDECRDIDIAASPFTNTLAIRRLDLHPGTAASIDVVYIDPQNCRATRNAQRYTRRPDREGKGLYHYQSLDTGFEAELPVDEDGLLLEYPGYFQRAW